MDIFGDFYDINDFCWHYLYPKIGLKVSISKLSWFSTLWLVYDSKNNVNNVSDDTIDADYFFLRRSSVLMGLQTPVRGQVTQRPLALGILVVMSSSFGYSGVFKSLISSVLISRSFLFQVGSYISATEKSLGSCRCFRLQSPTK